MSFLRGPDRTQTQLLPPSIEEYVPEDALVRVIEAFVETLDLEALGFARARPSATGRPGYDPADMLGLYIYGYVNRIRSSRRLECEAHRNLEVIWLMRNLRPDFKTISEFRRRNTGPCSGVLREFNLLCRQMDLFAAELVAIDGSKFKASNTFRKSYDEKQLRALIEKIDTGITAYLSTLEEGDREAEGGFGRGAGLSSSEEDQEQEKKAFREKLSRLKQEKQECQVLLDSLLSPDGASPDESPQTQALMGEAQPRKDVSRTDRDSRRLKNSKGPGTLVGYNVQVAVDGKHGLILATEVVPEANDLNQLSPMTQAVQKFLSLDSRSGNSEAALVGAETASKKLTVLADSGYCEAAHLEDCEKRGVIPIVPRPRTTMGQSNNGEKVYAKDAFHYDAAKNVYVCPAKHELTFYRERNRRGKITFDYITFDYITRACTGCSLKASCTKAHYRTITRRAEEGAVERSRARVEAQPHMMAVRQGLVEKVFGTMRMWGHDQFLLRGLPKVRGEFALSALAYNLRRCANIVGVPDIMKQLSAY